jgi:hypothetical protein
MGAHVTTLGGLRAGQFLYALWQNPGTDHHWTVPGSILNLADSAVLRVATAMRYKSAERFVADDSLVIESRSHRDRGQPPGSWHVPPRGRSARNVALSRPSLSATVFTPEAIVRSR